MTTMELKSLKRSMTITIISVLTPFLLAMTGVLVKDHYKITELDKYKVSKEYFDETWFSYQLLIEDKTNALETLSSNNDLSIAEIKEEIKTIQNVQQQTLIEIAKINRVRGGTMGSTISNSVDSTK